MGIFARNAVRQASHSKRFIHWLGGCNNWRKGVGVSVKLLIKIIAISRGKEVVNVYSMKYVPAVSRSVCCPHRVIIIRVGIRVASNIIYIRVRLEAMNVIEINSCRSVNVARKVRCRCSGSLVIVC